MAAIVGAIKIKNGDELPDYIINRQGINQKSKFKIQK